MNNTMRDFLADQKNRHALRHFLFHSRCESTISEKHLGIILSRVQHRRIRADEREDGETLAAYRDLRVEETKAVLGREEAVDEDLLDSNATLLEEMRGEYAEVAARLARKGSDAALEKELRFLGRRIEFSASALREQKIAMARRKEGRMEKLGIAEGFREVHRPDEGVPGTPIEMRKLSEEVCRGLFKEKLVGLIQSGGITPEAALSKDFASMMMAVNPAALFALPDQKELGELVEAAEAAKGEAEAAAEAEINYWRCAHPNTKL